jgi:hypothetical protein
MTTTIIGGGAKKLLTIFRGPAAPSKDEAAMSLAGLVSEFSKAVQAAGPSIRGIELVSERGETRIPDWTRVFGKTSEAHKFAFNKANLVSLGGAEGFVAGYYGELRLLVMANTTSSSGSSAPELQELREALERVAVNTTPLWKMFGSAAKAAVSKQQCDRSVPWEQGGTAEEWLIWARIKYDASKI